MPQSHKTPGTAIGLGRVEADRNHCYAALSRSDKSTGQQECGVYSEGSSVHEPQPYDTDARTDPRGRAIRRGVGVQGHIF